jgi:hypothetical protein
MKSILKNLNVTLKVIGWLQIIGGITGLGLMAYLLLQTAAINGALLLIFLTGISLYIFSMHCGILMLSPTTRKKGIILSAINQALQFIQWRIVGYGICYSSALNLSVGLNGSTLGFKFDIVTSSFSMGINSDDPFLLEINIVPILIFIVPVRAYEELKKPLQPEDFVIESEEALQPEQQI